MARQKEDVKPRLSKTIREIIDILCMLKLFKKGAVPLFSYSQRSIYIANCKKNGTEIKQKANQNTIKNFKEILYLDDRNNISAPNARQ